MSSHPAWTLGLYFAAGLMLGTVFFTTLRWTSDRLAAGRPVPATIAVMVVRFVLLGAALALASLDGAMALLLTALGVFVARAAVLRSTRAAPS